MQRDSSAPSPGLPADASLAELVAHTVGLQPWRRVVHAASGVALALGPGWLGVEPGATAVLLAVGSAALLGADVLRLRVPAANRLFFAVFSRLASPREARAVASSTWYAVGAAIVWAATPGTPAVAALLVLGLADPAASVVGRTWGRARLGKGTRLGSATFFAVALGVLAVTVGGPVAVLAAGAATVVEIASGRLDDNLTVPVTTAAVVWALPMLLPR